MTTWKLAVLVGAATAATVTGLALTFDGDETRGRDHAAPAAMVAERGDD